MRNLTKTLAILSLLTPVVGYPLGIGDFKLHSALNQNLNAEIPLTLSAGESAADIKVSLAPAAKFDEAGVPWTYFLSKISFKTEVNAKGGVVIKVSSREALKEPFLNLLVEVSWPKGSLYREFTVLIDPPSTYKTPVPIVAPVAVSTSPVVTTAPMAVGRPPMVTTAPMAVGRPPMVTTAPMAVGRPPMVTTAPMAVGRPPMVTTAPMAVGRPPMVTTAPMAVGRPSMVTTAPVAVGKPPVVSNVPITDGKPSEVTGTFLSNPRGVPTQAQSIAIPQEYVQHSSSGSSYGPIHKKETLWSVAVKFSKERDVSVEQMLMAIYQANPNAFYRNNVFGLMSGETLQIPDSKEVVRLSPEQAVADYNLQKKAWKSGVTLSTPDAVVAKKEVVSEPFVTPAKIVKPETPAVALADNNQKKITEPPLLVTPNFAKEIAAVSPEDTSLLDKVAALEKQLKATKKALASKEKQIDQIKSETQVATPEEVKPVAPIEAVKPATLVEEVKPVAPIEAVKPATPVEEVKPIAPIEAVKPATPVEEVKPIAPIEAVKLSIPLETIQPVISFQVIQPAQLEAIKPAILLEAIKPTAPTEAIKPTAPAEIVTAPVAPTEVIKPAIPVEVVKPTVPTEVVKPVVEDEPELMESLDPYYLLVGGGGLGLLSILGGLWWRNRKRAIDGYDGSPTPTKVVFKDVPLAVESEDNLGDDWDTPFNPAEIQGKSTFGDWDSFDIDTEQNDIDPISEADVYLAYGRYQQAEELMRDAIKEQPDRDECKLKLLEIFYASENRDAFEAYVGKLAGEGKKGDTEFWEKVMEMGSEICPDSALLSTENNVSQTTSKADFEDNVTNVVAVSSEEMLLAKNDFSDDVVVNKQQNNKDDFESMAIDLTGSDESDEFHKNDFESFDFDDFTLDDAKADVVAVAPETPALDNKNDFESFDFDDFALDDAKADVVAVAPETPALDNKNDFESFDFDDFALDDAKADVVAVATETPALDNKNDFESFDFDDFALDDAKADVVAVATETPALDNKNDFESFDFDDFALDDAKTDVVAVAPETPALDNKNDFESFGSGVANNIIDFDFDFDMPATGLDEQGANFDSPDLNDMDELETKLDLARAYIDMGDAQAAKDITEEVLKKGSPEQKKLAEAILEFLK